MIFENKYRFKDDPLYGEMMRDMWSEGLTTEQVVEINKRVVMDKRSLPDVFDDDCHYACPTNRHRNIISANNFRRHILATHAGKSQVYHWTSLNFIPDLRCHGYHIIQLPLILYRI